MTETLPPHHIESERAVLGGILIDPDALLEVPFLKAGDFYGGDHRAIFAAMRGLADKNMAIDPLTVSAALRGKVDEAVVFGLVTAVPDSSNTRTYARIVESHAQRRALIQAAGRAATAAYDTSMGIDAVVAEASAAMMEATDGAVGGGELLSARERLSALYDETSAAYARGGVVPGLPTGLADIDNLIPNGLEPGNLYLIGARPGMGKSALEGIIAHNIAATGKVVARFNLEMPANQLMQRWICFVARLDFQRLQRGQFSEAEYATFTRTVGELSERGMWIDDTPMLTPTQLLSRCRRLQARHGLDLVTVDYLQLMAAERNLGNRVQEVGEVSRRLKQIAKSLNVPIVALVQLSRGLEQRADKRPILSDLRDSGELEQDADVVMFIYRDEYYYGVETATPNQAEVIVGKHRNGQSGMARLYWDGDHMAFKNLARQEVRL